MLTAAPTVVFSRSFTGVDGAVNAGQRERGHEPWLAGKNVGASSELGRSKQACAS